MSPLRIAPSRAVPMATTVPGSIRLNSRARIVLWPKAWTAGILVALPTRMKLSILAPNPAMVLLMVAWNRSRIGLDKRSNSSLVRANV